MARFVTHSDNGDGEITIRPIHNGFIIVYKYLLGRREEFVADVEELNEWLADFYKREQ
jgi:hypothetical protein